MTAFSAMGHTAVTVSHVDPATRDAMYALLCRHFDGHRRDVFERDLAEKTGVILIREGDTLVGFSTFLVWREREDTAVFFSGDTIIDAAHWGTPLLGRAWMAAALAARRELGMRLYWFLLSGGYRTFRYLPLFFETWYPHPEAEMPSPLQELVHGWARRRYGERYRDGVVRTDGGWLRPEVSPVDARRAAHPHVRFFVEQNPGHAAGDELLCVTEVAPENMTSAGRKLVATVGG